MIDKVTGKRIVADANRYTIEALKAIRDCPEELPKNNKEFTEEDYNKLKINDNYRFKGYAGFSFSFGSDWLHGWCRNKRNRDYVEEAYNNAVKQSPSLQGIKLINSGYLDLQIPDNSLIYCDPPYEDATKYATGKFNHDSFWQCCRDKAKDGHIIFISEYNAPDDFICVWQREVTVFLNNDTGNTKKPTEKLFKYGDKTI